MNRHVVWDKTTRQIVLYEVISYKMEISWLQENQTLKWIWRKWLLNWIVKFYGYTRSKSQITCNKWQKSEISEKLKEDIILNLFKSIKKPYQSLFFERKNFILESRVKHCFRKSYLEVLHNENAPGLIKKFLRKHHAKKWKFSLRSLNGCFFY